MVMHLFRGLFPRVSLDIDIKEIKLSGKDTEAVWLPLSKSDILASKRSLVFVHFYRAPRLR